MFSQLSDLDNNNGTTKTSSSRTTADTTKQKRITRKNSTTIQHTEEIIDLDKEEEEEATSNGTIKPTIKEQPKNDAAAVITNENWIDVFAPSTSEELAIHPKKLLELQQWFQHCSVMKRKQPAQLCLLTGPSGSGKTAAVRTVAKENRIHIQEWINPVDQEVVYKLGDQLTGDSYNCSQVEAFKNFLFKASRYRSLLEPAGNKRLLMIEDFPNFLLKDPTEFQEILE